MDNNRIDIENYRHFLPDSQKLGYYGRLGTCFQTKNNYYFYDTGTGKIAKITKNVYCVLEALFENNSIESLYDLDLSEQDLYDALDEIKTGVMHSNILSAPLLQDMKGEMTIDLEGMLSDHMTTITLEMTQDCNLVCKYCIYHPDHPSYREFGKRHMTAETAKQSLDFLKKHSALNSEATYIGFYGGEPLLNFGIVKLVVEYAKEIFCDKELHFNLTTNAILLTEPVCDYLVKNDMSIMISLDGPKELHDKNRIFANNQGSYDLVIKGIQTLLTSYETNDKAPTFMINMVNAESELTEQYELIHDFFSNAEWLPPDTPIICNGVDNGPKALHYILPQSSEEKQHTDSLEDAIGSWNDLKTNDQEKHMPSFVDRTIAQELIRIHKRMISQKPVESYFVNGCCTPGQRKAYVSVEGDIFPCERVGNNIPSLGNVRTGFDFSKTKKFYVDDYIEQSKTICKNCWAVNLCGMCYVNCYDETGIKLEYKHTLCLYERLRIKSALIRYHKILENEPDRLRELNEIRVI